MGGNFFGTVEATLVERAVEFTMVSCGFTVNGLSRIEEPSRFDGSFIFATAVAIAVWRRF